MAPKRQRTSGTVVPTFRAPDGSHALTYFRDRENLSRSRRKRAMGEDDHMSFKCRAWLKVFDIDEPIYREFVLEFIATYVFEPKKEVDDCRQDCMQF
ncbi:hypothetical protein OSB04_019120 [Centaurea solstitialis]|uniref:Uncharacterized protein n=1 Tax=Centaurea solstitialis TaxID=347529 RepID=A0AA38W2J7_9ASTR|nr:hypothetical protein OSB04_019120 [Centaurea solstitialis]